MTWSIVQSKSAYFDSSGNTVAVTFDSNVTSGNLVVGFVWAWYPNSRYPSSATTTYDSMAIIGTPDTSNKVWAAQVTATTTGATTVTFTLDGANDYRRVWAVELSGHDSASPISAYNFVVDTVYGTGTDGASASITSPTGGLVLAIMFNGNSTTIPSVGTSYTNVLGSAFSGDSSRIEYREVAGSTNATFTLATGDSSDISVLALNPAGGGGGGGSVPVFYNHLQSQGIA